MTNEQADQIIALLERIAVALENQQRPKVGTLEPIAENEWRGIHPYDGLIPQPYDHSQDAMASVKGKPPIPLSDDHPAVKLRNAIDNLGRVSISNADDRNERD